MMNIMNVHDIISNEDPTFVGYDNYSIAMHKLFAKVGS
jgi:hypothetical protein